MSGMVRVFVYGTLKRGFRNHGLLSGAVFLGEAYSGGKYVLLDGGFPRMVAAEKGDPKAGHVHGELFRVTREQLARLDRLEGHPNFYVRKEIRVVRRDGYRFRAQAYIWPTPEVGPKLEPVYGVVSWNR